MPQLLALRRKQDGSRMEAEILQVHFDFCKDFATWRLTARFCAIAIWATHARLKWTRPTFTKGIIQATTIHTQHCHFMDEPSEGKGDHPPSPPPAEHTPAE